MSIESAKAFIERLKTDEDFRQRVQDAEDREARRALAKAEGFDFGEEDIKSASEELSDDDLDFIAGGSGCHAAGRGEMMGCATTVNGRYELCA